MGVKLNGVDLESTYGFDLANVEGLEAPSIRQNTATIPGLHGELDFGGTYATRNIYLVGHLSASTHAASITALQQFIQSTAVLPLRAATAPLDGYPLSPDSVLSTLELPDFTDRYLAVSYNGTFEAEWITARRIGKKIRVRIGFRQPRPWATAKEPSKFTGSTASGQNQHWANNDGGIAVPPKITFNINTDTVTSFSLYNHAIDPFNTEAITGTLGGTPLFIDQFGGDGQINAGLKFSNGTEFVTYPLQSHFSPIFGTIEMIYVPAFAAGDNDAVLWTLYKASNEYWRVWYDKTGNKFRFQMKTPSFDTTLQSSMGITGSGNVYYLAVSWNFDNAYFSVNGETRVSGAKNIITLPTTIRIGSFGDNTLPAKGTIDELIVWNRDVGAEYVYGVWNGLRYKRAFGRPVPGVLMYADYNFSIDAVGAGNKTFTYNNIGNPLDIGDYLIVDMERQTTYWWDASAKTRTNVISAVSNHFFDLMPGINTFNLPYSGSGNMTLVIHFQKRYLL